MNKNFLAALSPREFLRRHWQKRPLLARRALPQYGAMLTHHQLFALAAREDVQSRLVTRVGNRWAVAHGPFATRRLERMPATGWTLLVQGVNHVLPAAESLLLEFAFIPYARLDDVMVSYAPPGGGVGPHFDSYDVFLLQISGRRRWRVSSQRDLTLIDNAPLKLLRRFRPRQTWTLEPGDLLYLPPNAAHEGTAVDHCLTASIGFRAPSAQELGARFLEFLQDELALTGEYRDPGLELQRRPGHIARAMLRRVAHLLDGIDWRESDVLAFLGRYLTEPKPHVFFVQPRRPLSIAAFARRTRQRGVKLDPKTQMLFHGRQIFMNGEQCDAGDAAAPLLTKLADRRSLVPPVRLNAQTAAQLYQWYRAGYIELGGAG